MMCGNQTGPGCPGPTTTHRVLAQGQTDANGCVTLTMTIGKATKGFVVNDAKGLLLKMALRAIERGDAEGAAQALRGVLALAEEPDRPQELRAVNKGSLCCND